MEKEISKFILIAAVLMIAAAFFGYAIGARDGYLAYQKAAAQENAK